MSHYLIFLNYCLNFDIVSKKFDFLFDLISLYQNIFGPSWILFHTHNKHNIYPNNKTNTSTYITSDITNKKPRCINRSRLRPELGLHRNTEAS